MALAPYYDRAAQAASQVIAGFDSDAFRERVTGSCVGVHVGPDATSAAAGRHLLDLTVRLLARFYPAIRLSGLDDGPLAETRTLIEAINPRIESRDQANATIVIGTPGSELADAGRLVFAGCSGFDALISTNHPQLIGEGANPFGAGASAALACSNVFRALFMGDVADEEFVFSTLTGELAASPVESDQVDLMHEITLIGIGAIGNAALWALQRCAASGTLHLVDNERVEASNLQLYVLATPAHEDTPKVNLGEDDERLRVVRHNVTIEEYAANCDQAIAHAVVGLDSAEARRRVQASLPKIVDNAWTQPGDLGVSRHGGFGTDAACVYCLYLPDQATLNEDQLVAKALNIEPRLMEVRHLLYTNDPLTRPFLEGVAAALDIEIDPLLPFDGKPLRTLYVEGLCGGAIIPLETLGQPRQEMHVPLAHQSALAGVLLAAAAIGRSIGREIPPTGTRVTRINVLRRLAGEVTQPAAIGGHGVCICEDDDYRIVFNAKWAAVEDPAN